MDINFVAQIIPYIQLRKFKTDELIFKKNEYPNFIYFLLEGRIGFYNDQNRIFKTYIEGSYFGEIEIYKSCLRQFKCKALEETRILQLPRDQFLSEIKHFPDIAQEIHFRAIQRDIINKKDSLHIQKIGFLNFDSTIDPKVKEQLFEQ